VPQGVKVQVLSSAPYLFMSMPVPAETYHELVVEVGRTHLDKLAASLGSNAIQDDVVGWSHDIKPAPKPWKELEHTTTYRTSVYPDIDKSMLRHPHPPSYFYTMVGALTEAMVDHHNNSMPRHSAIMRPHEEDLRLQLDTVWAGLAESSPFVEGDEMTIFETPPYKSIRLAMARRNGKLTLDFAYAMRYAKFWLR
jgi:hypothetical protein